MTLNRLFRWVGFFDQITVKLNVLVVGLALWLGGCGSNCKETAFFCPKSENFRRLKNTFELGDYWILQGKAGSVDSVYISEVNGVLDTCFTVKTSCDDRARGGAFKLSGTLHGKSLIDSEINYSLPKGEKDDENKLFCRLITGTTNTDRNEINSAFVFQGDGLVKYSETSAVLPFDTIIDSRFLDNTIVTNSGFRIFDLDIGFVQIIFDSDTLDLIRTSN